MGKTLSSLMMILGFGVMLGKLIAEIGAAVKITHELVTKFVLKHIQFSLILIGFIIGIPSILTTKYLISGIMNRLVPKLKPEFIILNSNSHFITPSLRLSLIIPTPSDNHRREFIVSINF